MLHRKLTIILTLIISLFPLLTQAASAADTKEDSLGIDAPSAILIEVGSGEILYQKDAFFHRSPASVTKLMTMLLAAEAVDSGIVKLGDTVTASAKAASMGGSQIWLEEGESMSFGEMLKCLTVVSANDCCVAIAEHLAGSEGAFVEKMNTRARELGLENSNFKCSSGLSDSDEHYSCAHDLAVIARELLKHDFIKDYTTIWTDTVRGGEFVLNNTNKLLRRCEGITGLKTGYTGKAGHCLAASAERDGEEYIAVVLGADRSAARFDAAKMLLEYAYANYKIVNAEKLSPLPPLSVKLGSKDSVELCLGANTSFPIKKDSPEIRAELTLPRTVEAPLGEGEHVGSMQIYSGDELIREIPILSSSAVEKIGFLKIFLSLVSSLTA